MFFALWPDAAVLESLDALARQGKERCGGRRMRRDSLHLTLEFIGAVTPCQLDQLLVVGERLQGTPFAMVLDRCGYWPHNRILWAGCHATPSPLRRLSEFLRGTLVDAGFRIESRPFVPHVTLLRQARCEGLPELVQPIHWQSTGFALVESFLQPSGARYRTLREWSLNDSA